MKPVLAEKPSLSLAALNGTHLVVSGPVAELNLLQQALSERKIRSKSLNTSHAFHSSLMEPVLRPFQDVADSIVPGQPQIPLVCNLSGALISPEKKLDGSYWARHIREPVRYSESIESINQAGCNLLLEIGPQAVLTGMAASNWNGPETHRFSFLPRRRSNAKSDS